MVTTTTASRRHCSTRLSSAPTSGHNVGQRFPEPIPCFGASAANPNTSVNWAQYLPITGVPSFYNRNVPPYSESYTLSIRATTGNEDNFQASYAGSQAHHLLVVLSANPGNPALCLALSQAKEVTPSSATCGPFGESGTYIDTKRTGDSGNARAVQLPVRGVTYQKTIGNSSYNALQ